jgi:hypothetical protein
MSEQKIMTLKELLELLVGVEQSLMLTVSIYQMPDDTRGQLNKIRAFIKKRLGPVEAIEAAQPEPCPTCSEFVMNARPPGCICECTADRSSSDTYARNPRCPVHGAQGPPGWEHAFLSIDFKQGPDLFEARCKCGANRMSASSQVVADWIDEHLAGHRGPQGPAVTNEAVTVARFEEDLHIRKIRNAEEAVLLWRNDPSFDGKKRHGEAVERLIRLRDELPAIRQKLAAALEPRRSE